VKLMRILVLTMKEKRLLKQIARGKKVTGAGELLDSIRAKMVLL
jgi:hypothetical protein